jgi:hypothetical protein
MQQIMNPEILKIVGQVAGIGGLALGVFLILFRDVIRKNIFPRLNEVQAYRLLIVIVILVWSIAIVGIVAWVYTHRLVTTLSTPAKVESQSETEPKSDVEPKFELTTNLPIKFGDSRKTVYEKLGTPQERGVVVDTFYNHGLKVYYSIDNFSGYGTDDDQDVEVDGFLLKRLDSGTRFRGTVLGVKFDDTFDTVRQKLGEPIDWGLPYTELSLAMWKVDENVLICYFWRKMPDDSGRYPDAQLGRVQGIIYCDSASFACYEPLVSIAIQQMRNGIKPSNLHSERAIDIDINAPFLQEEYDILNSELFPHGGAYSIVKFEGGEHLLFWLYPKISDSLDDEPWFPYFKKITKWKSETKGSTKRRR